MVEKDDDETLLARLRITLVGITIKIPPDIHRKGSTHRMDSICSIQCEQSKYVDPDTYKYKYYLRFYNSNNKLVATIESWWVKSYVDGKKYIDAIYAAIGKRQKKIKIEVEKKKNDTLLKIGSHYFNRSQVSYINFKENEDCGNFTFSVSMLGGDSKNVPVAVRTETEAERYLQNAWNGQSNSEVPDIMANVPKVIAERVSPEDESQTSNVM